MHISVRTKMQAIVGGTLIVLAFVISLFSKRIIVSSFRNLESHEINVNIQRLDNASKQLKYRLWDRLFDWAAWDDAYRFVQDGNSEFRKTNLGAAELASNHIDFVSFIRPDGSQVATAVSLERGRTPKVNIPSLIEEIGSTSPSNMERLTNVRAFFILHNGSLMNIAVRPVTPTNTHGKHVGWMIWGQYISRGELNHMARQLRLSVDSKPYSAIEKEENFSTSTETQTEAIKFRYKVVDGESIESFLPINDVNNKPIWAHRVYNPRDIYAHGVATFGSLFEWLVMGSLALCLILFMAIDFLILRRINRLTHLVTTHADPADVYLNGNDELSKLARKFQETLTEVHIGKIELTRLNEGLERTIDDRTKDLTEAIEEAERANGAKSEFLSRMSHELRTPLNAVIGFAQLIEMRSPDKETSDCVDAILKGGKHLLCLVNEILDLSQIEAGAITITPEPVQVAGTLQQAVDMLKQSAQARNIELTIEQPPQGQDWLMVDQQRLLQVFINVISNAVKYNREGGKIFIRCFDQPGNRYRIEIQDTGQGVDESRIDRLFTPFERLGQSRVEGAGLGLALSKNFTRMMGGELSLIHTSSEGSTFALDFPKHEASPVLSLVEQDHVSCTGESIRVLLFVSEHSDPRLLEKVLEDLGGFELVCAPQADDGIEFAENYEPEIVLVDMSENPKRTINFVRELRVTSTMARVPIVLLAEDTSVTTIEKLPHGLVTETFLKPLDLTKLVLYFDRVQADSQLAA